MGLPLAILIWAPSGSQVTIKVAPAVDSFKNGAFSFSITKKHEHAQICNEKTKQEKEMSEEEVET